MAYKVIILYQLYMPSYFLGTFTEYPYLFFYFFLLTCYSLSCHLHFNLNYILFFKQIYQL